MIRMMRAQQSGARRLPHFLNVPVGHKTGDFPPAARERRRHRVGALRPDRHRVLRECHRGPYAEAEDRIGRIAQLIVEYFDGAR